MRSKIVRASLVLMTLGLPSVAAADSYTNSGYLNSGYLNSGYLNSGYLNSGYLNSGYLNSGYLNGGSTGGVTMGKMKTAQGQSIDNVVVTKDYLVGSAWVWEIDHFSGFTPVYEWHYRTIEKDDFLNATFEATVNDGQTDQLVGSITAKITAVKTLTTESGTTRYQHVVKWKDAQTGELTPVCGCENNNDTCTAPVPATISQGLWNYTQGTIDGGRKISNDPNLMTIACAGGAIAKCTSDKATMSPLTPGYSGTVSPAAGTWVHKGAWIVYPGEKLNVKLTNVTGNPNLYVRWNEQATGASYSCRPALGSGYSETCPLTVPNSAYYAYISVYGSTASSATLSVSATGAKPRGMGYKTYGTMFCTYNMSTGASSCTTSPTLEVQSCTRMVTADYCGDGTSHTMTGRPIEVYDNYNPMVNDEGPDADTMIFESEWTPDGANSVGQCRVGELDLSDADPNECPVYGTYQHDVAQYLAIYDNYGNPIGCAANQSNSGVYTNRSNYLYNLNNGEFHPRIFTRSHVRIYQP
jgi:hypothetical protein